MNNEKSGSLYFKYISDDKVTLTGLVYGIYIHILNPITLTGEPSNVILNYSGYSIIDMNDGEGYRERSIKLSGWIKDRRFITAASATKTSPASLYYECDVTIEFAIGDDEYKVTFGPEMSKN